MRRKIDIMTRAVPEIIPPAPIILYNSIYVNNLTSQF
jgi:hypothetical protein